MKPQLFAEANGSGVTLLICAGSSTAITVDVATATKLLEALAVAVDRARKQEAALAARRYCRRCWRECHDCVCSSAGKGGAA